MSPENMRSAISNVYTGKKWKEKVRNMSDNQVMAVYFSFMEKSKLNPKKSVPKTNEQKDVQHYKPYIGEQLSFF